MNAAYTALAIIGILAVGLLLLGIYCSACHIAERRRNHRRMQDILQVKVCQKETTLGTDGKGDFVHGWRVSGR